MQSPSNQGLLKQMDGISLKVLRFPRKKVETYFQMGSFIDIIEVILGLIHFLHQIIAKP